MNTLSSLATVPTRVLVLAALLAPGVVAAQTSVPYERPEAQSASKLLPQQLLSNPNYQVQDTVASDGFLDIYAIESRWGSLEAVSTAQLREFLAELDVVARLEQLKSSKEFSGAMKAVAGGVVQGTGALLKDPMGSLSGAMSGVGAAFARANEALTSTAKGAEEGGALSQLSGYAKVKRDYASEFGVDVYSRNPILQEHLDAVTKAGFAGSITARAALMAVPGGAGAAISVAKNTQGLNDMFRDLPPLELRKRSRAHLEAMHVDPDVADLFIANTTFTVREQTLLVDALTRMPGAENREAFVRHAVLTPDADMALFRQRQAQMYAAYNQDVKSLAQFVSVGDVAVGQRADGVIVFCAPLDHLFWTPTLGAFVQVFEGNLAQVPGVKGKELVLGGTLSPAARKGLESGGWTIVEGAESRLLGAR